jgi:hypothetical protein
MASKTKSWAPIYRLGTFLVPAVATELSLAMAVTSTTAK